MKITSVCKLILLSVNLMEAYLWSGFPHSLFKSHKHRNYNQNTFLPSPPGTTPDCAAHGATFCESVGTYPSDTIQNLLYKRKHTYSLFITSETNQEFVMRDASNYGAYHSDEDRDINVPPIENGGYGPPHFNSSQQNLHWVPSAEGYPSAESHHYDPAPNQMNTAAVGPVLPSFWWNHAQRNGPYAEQPYSQHTRKRRQAPQDQLCAAQSRFVTPEAAMNNDGDWMYIVNMQNNPRYAQQVRIETCVSAGSDCSGICQTPPGYRATCRQKYTQKRLVSLDGSGSTLRNGIFWIPLCCYCEIGRI